MSLTSVNDGFLFDKRIHLGRVTFAIKSNIPSPISCLQHRELGQMSSERFEYDYGSPICVTLTSIQRFAGQNHVQCK